MKNLFLLLAVLCLFSSCSKDDESAKDDISANKENSPSTLTGKWEWTESSGGIAGLTYTPISTNKTVILEISNDRIKFIENGETRSDRAYTIQSKKSIYGEQKEMIVYEQNSEILQSFEIKGTELLLHDECFDCFTHNYIRK